MVVQQRSELSRSRFLCFLTIILATAALVVSLMTYSSAGESLRAALVLLGLVGLVALVLALLQIYGHPPRSHALLLHRGTEMIVATNAVHEGYKLRFLRDVLSESVATLSDEERARWKFLEADGYYPALSIRNPRKILILRLCTMLFDDVFAVDASGRWEHHDSASTAEPAYAKGEKPPVKALEAWKELDAGSRPG
jgi:hypothetical protein